MAKSSKTTSSKAPWDKPNPKAAKGRSRKLSPSQKAGAKRSAKKAGRPYPSLVDNMNAAKIGSKKSGAKIVGRKIVGQEIIGQEIGDQEIVDEEERGPEILGQEGAQVIPQVGIPSASAHASRSIGMAASKAAKTRDPKGGLTAAGRAAFKRKQGANLKPGVKKAMAEMTPDEMRRKGSWAARFYGRETLPPLTKKNGEPTRFALSAAAWGEPVPKTEAAARKIAAKGERLLARYRSAQGQGLRSKVFAPEGCSACIRTDIGPRARACGAPR